MKFKSHFYYEEKDHVAEAEKQLKPSRGSKVWIDLVYSLHANMVRDFCTGFECFNSVMESQILFLHKGQS